MELKTEPPISKSTNSYKGWSIEPFEHSASKTFKFTTEEAMNQFSLLLLVSEHDKNINLSLSENHKDLQVQVDIFGKDFREEMKGLIRAIEEWYCHTELKEKSHGFWFW